MFSRFGKTPATLRTFDMNRGLEIHPKKKSKKRSTKRSKKRFKRRPKNEFQNKAVKQPEEMSKARLT